VIEFDNSQEEEGWVSDHEKKIGRGNLARNDGYPHWNYFGLGGVAAGVAPLVASDGRSAASAQRSRSISSSQERMGVAVVAHRHYCAIRPPPKLHTLTNGPDIRH
jgi:hypothetical protein